MLRQEGIAPLDEVIALAVTLDLGDAILAQPFELDTLGLGVLQARILDLGPQQDAQAIDRLALHIDAIAIQLGLQPRGRYLPHLGGLGGGQHLDGDRRTLQIAQFEGRDGQPADGFGGQQQTPLPGGGDPAVGHDRAGALALILDPEIPGEGPGIRRTPDIARTREGQEQGFPLDQAGAIHAGLEPGGAGLAREGPEEQEDAEPQCQLVKPG